MAVLSMSLAGAALPRLRNGPDKVRGRPLNVPGSFASAAVPRPRAREGAADGPVALLTGVSEGVCIVRRNEISQAQAGAVLRQGDRVIVPGQGYAQAVFQEQDGQMLTGRFEGGTDARLAYFSRKDGACSVVFDLAAGHVDLSLTALPRTALNTGAGEGAPARRAIGFHCHAQAIACR